MSRHDLGFIEWKKMEKKCDGNRKIDIRVPGANAGESDSLCDQSKQDALHSQEVMHKRIVRVSTIY